MSSSVIVENNIISKIERLWVMAGASVLKDHKTKDIVGYLCYCENCKEKSINGNGGIAFDSAEKLLIHRNMEAFECPIGCGYHVCKQFGSITRHITDFHSEFLSKLIKEGLDPELKKRVMIYPDYSNGTYTLNKPMPQMDASPLENAGVILSMTPPKRVEATATPPPPPPQFKSKKKFVPLEFSKQSATAEKPAATVEKPAATAEKSAATAEKPAITSGKTWNKIEKAPIVSLTHVMETLAEEKTKEYVAPKAKSGRPVYYAQEDMLKEKQCKFGMQCTGHDRPFACAFNHDGKDNLIPYGTQLTEEVLCPFERPPFFRCGDCRCIKPHLEGRVKFIEEKKAERYISTSQFADKEQAGFFKISLKEAVQLSAACKKKKNRVNEVNEDEELMGERAPFSEHATTTIHDEQVEDEDSEDEDEEACLQRLIASHHATA